MGSGMKRGKGRESAKNGGEHWKRMDEVGRGDRMGRGEIRREQGGKRDGREVRMRNRLKGEWGKCRERSKVARESGKGVWGEGKIGRESSENET